MNSKLSKTSRTHDDPSKPHLRRRVLRRLSPPQLEGVAGGRNITSPTLTATCTGVSCYSNC